jgi:hypothetical protein
MFTLGPIGFSAPFLLFGLLALPVLWLLLRAVPPAPVKRLFPGVVLLLGLTDNENQADKTPWWLLLLRMLAIAAVIIGFAGPVLNPQARVGGSGPLLILADGTWADAGDWSKRRDRIGALLDEASRDGRVAAVVLLTDLPVGDVPFQAADAWATRLPGITPAPWLPDAQAVTEWAGGLKPGGFETFWLSDGLQWDGRAAVLAALEARGVVTVMQNARPVAGLRPPTFEDGAIQISVLRSSAESDAVSTVTAIGLDPAGTERELARIDVTFASGETEAQTALSLPPELRNRISRFALQGVRSAGAVTLADDGLRRREIALIAGSGEREGLQLLSPLHYLRQALEPTADLLRGGLEDVLPANPDVIVLADVAKLPEGQRRDLTEWVNEGGLLVRFAGIRMAASDVGRGKDDPLLPVRLRAGGRTVGGALSWGEPRALAPFGVDSPFAGLHIPDDVQVTSQVVAQPGPQLAERVIAQLADGTPLVTRKVMGDGQVVLFHVTANAEWSTLPLSGLFVQMLERLAISSRPVESGTGDLEGTLWVPVRILDAFGEIGDAGTVPGVAGEVLARGIPGPGVPPGVYRNGERNLAVNAVGPETVLEPAVWPARIVIEGLGAVGETLLKGAFLAAALVLLMLDLLASLMVSGRLTGPRGSGFAALVLCTVAGFGGEVRAQDEFALAATSEVVLAHVITGDSEVDKVAHAGLTGLSRVLFSRTTIEPAAPIAVDLEMDEVAFFPFLYWPVAAGQPLPSEEAYAKLNRYLRGGGMILFDTRDGDIAGFGGTTPEGKKLQQLARALDIPPLEPLPEDHVLTRSFYLLQDYPGRFTGRAVWVEAAPADAVQAEGMLFRNLNDGVTPVVIGGNDWAAAWAVDGRGNFLFRVGRGYTGERQREIAYRFGVNLIMHVLTGNYKSDQVHVPALLERLGQ